MMRGLDTIYHYNMLNTIRKSVEAPGVHVDD